MSVVGLSRLREELARFTYRPQWMLSIQESLSSVGVPTLGSVAYYLVVDFRAEDSCHPGREIKIGSRQQIPEWLLDAEAFTREQWSREFGGWVQRALFKVEEHESREWLRRDGVVFDDPHAGGRSSL